MNETLRGRASQRRSSQLLLEMLRCRRMLWLFATGVVVPSAISTINEPAAVLGSVACVQ